MEPQRHARVAVILSAYAVAWAALVTGLGVGGPFAPIVLAVSTLVTGLALLTARRLGQAPPMPRSVVVINVATGAVIALVAAVMAASGRTALIGPAVALVMAVHFAPLAVAQRRAAPAVLGVGTGLIGLFALYRGGAQANALAAGLSAVAFDLAALHQLWLSRRRQAAATASIRL